MLNRNHKHKEDGFTTSEILVATSMGVTVAVIGGSLLTQISHATGSVVNKDRAIHVGDTITLWQENNPGKDALEEGVISEAPNHEVAEGLTYTLARYDGATGQFCLDITLDANAGRTSVLYNSDKQGEWQDCSFVSDHAANAPEKPDPFGYTVLVNNGDGTFTKSNT